MSRAIPVQRLIADGLDAKNCGSHFHCSTHFRGGLHVRRGRGFYARYVYVSSAMRPAMIVVTHVLPGCDSAYCIVRLRIRVARLLAGTRKPCQPDASMGGR